MGAPHAPLKDRFERYVVRKRGCWKWRGSKDAQGYGQLSFGKMPIKASRASYLLFCGELKPRRCVLHKCDNPECTNPKHLFLGSKHDNLRDAAEKGRMPRGERHHNSKLTAAKIRKILASKDLQKTIAQRFGIHPGTVSQIKRGLRWKHIFKESERK